MAIDLVSSADPRFAEINKGKNNGRFPTQEGSAAAIALCQTSDDVAQALEAAVKAGKRPTLRSGGHCYEDFVYNNPGGTILDVRNMTKVSQDPATRRWKIEAGATIGQTLSDLYKQGNVTITSASCNTVGIGGHWSGGGYGHLIRLLGPALDWVTAVDIVTIDAKGKVQVRHADKTHDADLLRAVRGSGGGNYGIVTAFYCDKLPPAPKEILTGRISFDWGDMTPERLHRILYLYANYWDMRGHDRDTWGLFAIMSLAPVTGPNSRFGMSVQFCNPDGTAQNTKVLDEFFAVFDECKPVSEIAHSPNMPGASHMPDPSGPGQIVCLAQHNVMLRSWIEATVGTGGGEGGGEGSGAARPAGAAGAGGGRAGGAGGAVRPLQRQKYKSAYMRKPYTLEEAAVFVKYMTDGNKYAAGVSVAMNCYGGAACNPARLEDTAHAQRDSIIKMQFITGWRDQADDKPRMEWLDKFYTELFTVSSDGKHPGTPYFSDRNQGCYINYPDKDMTRYSYWPQLYWGNGDLYPFLQRVKKKYDANNVFHHAMSVRT